MRSVIFPYQFPPAEEQAMRWWSRTHRRRCPRIYATQNIQSSLRSLKDDVAWHDGDYRAIFLSERFFKLEIDQRILVLFHEAFHSIGIRSEKKCDVMAGYDFLKMRIQ